jgi:hypothetical protein
MARVFHQSTLAIELRPISPPVDVLKGPADDAVGELEVDDVHKTRQALEGSGERVGGIRSSG